MKHLLAAMALALAAAGAGAQGDEKKDEKAAPATLEPAGLNVSKQINNPTPGGFPLRMANTSMAFAVTLKGQSILSVDRDSKVGSVKDDKGTDLAKTKFFGPNFTMNTFSMSGDRSMAIVELFVSNAPIAGASKIALKGDLLVVVGKAPKTAEAKDQEIKNGATLEVGDFKIKINSDGGAFFGASATIESKWPGIKGVELLDADGKDVGVNLFGGFFNGKTYNASFNAKKKVDKATIRVTYFSKDEKIKVPVDLTFALDLSGK